MIKYNDDPFDCEYNNQSEVKKVREFQYKIHIHFDVTIKNKSLSPLGRR